MEKALSDIEIHAVEQSIIGVKSSWIITWRDSIHLISDVALSNNCLIIHPQVLGTIKQNFMTF